jgi:hypothetical protein
MKQAIRPWLALIALATMFAGCASAPKVVVAGKDGNGTSLYALARPTGLNAGASREAAQYCQKRGKSAVIQDAVYRDASFTFSCSTD